MPSFREKLKAKGEAVVAREAEAARLSALPPAELAALLMPAFGPDGPKANPSILNPGNRGGTNENQLLDWLGRTYEVFPIRPKPWRLLSTRVLEAVQLLEHAGLIYVALDCRAERPPLERHPGGPGSPCQWRCHATHPASDRYTPAAGFDRPASAGTGDASRDRCDHRRRICGQTPAGNRGTMTSRPSGKNPALSNESPSDTTILAA